MVVNRYSGGAVVAWLLTCIFFSSLQAQTTQSLHFESLTIKDGLSQGFISCIEQDKKGLMWFGTSDGLNKYDGYAFTVYHHDPQNPRSIADNEVALVKEDSRERLWICFRKGGIDLFDREHGRFLHIRPNSSAGFISGTEFSLAEDAQGAIWISTPYGIDRMVPAEKSEHDRPLPRIEQAWHRTVIKVSIAAANGRLPVVPRIFADANKALYLSYARAVYQVKELPALKQIQLRQALVLDTLLGWRSALYRADTVSQTTFLHTEAGLYKWDPVKKMPPRLILPHQFPYNIAWDVWAPDQNGSIWLNEHSSLMRWRDGVRQTIVPDRADQQVATQNVYCFYSDRTGVLWIGTSGYGILKYDPGKEQFHASLSGEYIYRIFQNKSGNLVYQTNKEMLIGEQGSIHTRPLVANSRVPDGSNGEAFFSTEDHKGDYWFCDNRKLVKYQPGPKQITSYNLPPEVWNTSWVMPVADRQNNIWISTGQTLIQFQVATATYRYFPYPVRSQTNDFVHAIYEEDGIFWLGTQNGVFRFDYKSENWMHWRHHEEDSTTLSQDFVLSFAADPREPARYLWVGTKGGLNKMDKKTGRFRRITTQEGLPNNVIYGLLSDNDGHLWMSTNKGICRFDPVSGSIRRFDEEDGLQSDEFNRYAYTKMREGLLVFGGVNGINYFDPREIKPLEAPEVLLTDFRVFNKSVDFTQPLAPLQQDISYTTNLRLPYEQNMFTLQFSAMDYRRSGRVQYRYRLLGFDKDWIYNGLTREATYTNLDPGTYQFVVEGSNSLQEWRPASRRLTIQIIAPWWRTGWFYTLVLMTVSGMVYGVYRYRVNQLLKVERVRNRIARDLHDEVGSSLSTISIYTKLVQKEIGQEGGATPLLQKISDNTSQIQDSMNDIVWSINAHHDELESLADRMREHAVELLEPKGYILHTHFDPTLFSLKLDMERRKDFFLIYKEALNNLAKYASGRQVWIHLETEGRKLRFVIRDDGVGFDPAARQDSGNGMRNMQARAAALQGKLSIQSAPGCGTTVTLVFPR